MRRTRPDGPVLGQAEQARSDSESLLLTEKEVATPRTTEAAKRPLERQLRTKHHQEGTSERLLTEKEVAKILNVSVRTVQKWRSVRSDKLPFVVLSRRCIRYRPSDLAAFVRERVRRSTSDDGSPVSRREAPE